jgi:hypothetical protein
VLGELQRAFPRNRILWLEDGATALRAGRPADAERVLAKDCSGWPITANLRQDRAGARARFQQAVKLAEEDNDQAGEAAAKRWLRTPYRR